MRSYLFTERCLNVAAWGLSPNIFLIMQHSKKQTKKVEQALALLTTSESQQMVFDHLLESMSRYRKGQLLTKLYNEFFMDSLTDFSEVLTIGSLIMLSGVSAADDFGGESISVEFTSDIRNFFDSLACFNVGVRNLKLLNNG